MKKLLLFACILTACTKPSDTCRVGDSCVVRNGYHDKGDPVGVLHAYALDTGYTAFWGGPFLRLKDSRDTTWYMEAKGLVRVEP